MKHPKILILSYAHLSNTAIDIMHLYTIGTNSTINLDDSLLTLRFENKEERQ